MSCEKCLSRREFLARSAAAAAGVAVIAAGCGDGQFGPSAVVASAGAVTLKVSSVTGLATVGQLVQISPSDKFVAVKRTSAAPPTFAAFSMICTHEGCPTLIRSNHFECDCHGSQFDNSGHVTQGPAARDLPTVPTSYDPATDTLTIG
jgi:Rieske Fe-S protein